MLFFVEMTERYDADDHTEMNIGTFDNITSARAAAISAMDSYRKDHYTSHLEAYVWHIKINTPIQKYVRMVTYYKLENNQIVRYNVIVAGEVNGKVTTKIDYDHPEVIKLV